MGLVMTVLGSAQREGTRIQQAGAKVLVLGLQFFKVSD
jgi:hypothetical protein